MQARQSLQRGYADPAGTAVRQQAASRRPRVAAPAAEGPGAGAGDPLPRESRTRRPFRTASYSVLLYVYLPTPEPPDPENAQAVPGINLRVNSQTYEGYSVNRNLATNRLK